MDNPFATFSPEDLGDLRGPLGLFRILDPDGNLVAESDPDLPSELLLSIYEHMVRARILDEWLLRLQRVGRVALHAPNKGQEAIAGAVASLSPDDWIFPSYRELAAYIARGMSEEEILDRALYNVDDPLRGSEFAIYGHRKYNMVPAPVPVGSHIPLAVGAAMAAKILRHKRVMMAIFGDGATSRADFHAGLNFAGVFKAPVVLIAQNNQWAISMPARRQTASLTIAIKAVAYGIPGLRVDGNDPLALYLASKEAVERAREGGGPTLIESVTYRLGAHTTADDPSRYRSPEEEKFFASFDPIRRMRAFLIAKGVLTEKEDEALWRGWGEKIEKAVKRCYSKPPLPVSVIFENVYSKPIWTLEEQMAELEEALKLMEELGMKVE